MTRSTAREIAAHLILGMEYTGQSTEEALETLLQEDYYACLAAENSVYEERPNKRQLRYIREVTEGCASKAEELNSLIAKYSIGWPVSRISRLVRAILRLAIYEILYVNDVPTSAAINEAVMLTRKYEDEEIVSFVNGILGSFSRDLPDKAEPSEPDEEEQP